MAKRHPPIDGPDARIAAIATRQHGVVSRRQLEEAGLGRRAVEHRLARGRLHRLPTGAYAVGHVATGPRAREVAALLVCDARAALSHRSAAALWGIVPAILRDHDPVDVVADSGTGRRRAGVRLHILAALDPGDVRRREGLRVTSVLRTLADLGTVLPAGELERSVHEAQARRLVTHAQVEALVDRWAGRAGVRILREAIADPAAGFTRSEAERELGRLIARARLPAPERNVRVLHHEVDALWRAERFVVEVDGWAFHGSRTAFEHDRRRDAELRAHGFRVARFTWRQLTREPELVCASIAAALLTDR